MAYITELNTPVVSVFYSKSCTRWREGWASEYPRIPGHEVVDIVEQIGEGVSKWKTCQRVGIGWHGGHGHTHSSYH